MRLEKTKTLDDVLGRLAELGDGAQVLAGGTDVMIQLARGEISPEVLVPIHHLSDLDSVGLDGRAEIGALVTHEAVAAGALGDGFAALREGAATVGGWQTQTVGTVVGNVCNASPAADTLPPLLVHDAEIHLRSSRSDRSLSLGEFLLGRRRTARRPDELVTSITMPIPEHRTGDVYLKVGRRGAMEVAIVGYAMKLRFGDDDTVSQARIAIGSVAAAPLRAVSAEARLEGRRLDAAVAAEVAEAIQEEISPIDDLRGSARYRRRLIPGLTRRAMLRCASRAGATADLEEEAA